MQLKELKTTLALHPEALPRFILPDGGEIPAHFHITEVGHVTKKFIDCGGRLHARKDSCLLQTHVADDVDHRLNAGRLAKILQLGELVLPHDELEVEVEYDCCVVAQYPIASAEFAGEYVELQLGEKHTACLARERCGSAESQCEEGAMASCC